MHDATDPHDRQNDPQDPAPVLTRAQEGAILALLTEPSISAAATKACVGERTLHNWLKHDPDFMAEYRRARREAFSQAIGLTQRAAAAAVATLLRVMHDSGSSASARVAAASQVLKFARESIELDDLAVRVESLEDTIKKEDAA